jgi:SAM-dependent methyltransferase
MKFGPFEGSIEKASCPLCTDRNCSTQLIFKNIDGIGFYRCLYCNLMFASPRFTEDSMLKIYENEAFADLLMYDKWSYESWVQDKDRSYNIEQQKILLVKKYLPEKSRLLDVGCGTGLFVLEANKNGFLCEGIEPSIRLSRIGSNVLKIQVSTIQIENYNPTYKFNGIIIWDVLEHLYDPVRVVRRCRELLEPDGFLFLQVPNHKGISNLYKTQLCCLGLKKNNFKHFGFPWHVYSFDKKSLSILSDLAELKPVFFESWSHLLKDGKKDSLSQVIINLVKQGCLSDYIVCVAQKISR